MAAVTSGCEAIAGIEDRHLELADGGQAARPSSSACKAYCKDVIANCTDEFAVYSSEQTCEKICARLPAGDPKATTGNTLACRARNARLAGETQEFEVHCPFAGPGGGSQCGPDCESYCDLFSAVCPDDAVDDCVRKCGALVDLDTFDVGTNHDNDTLECRLVHTSSASLEPVTHCWHARIAPIGQGDLKNPCADPPDKIPTCEDYCRIATTACTGELAVYDSEAECKRVCRELDVGVTGDTTADTVGCRRYHSYNSIEAPDNHCPHAGPGADGHCGTSNCPPYCRLLEAACPAEFASEFVGGAAACETACATLDGAKANSGYSVAAAEKSGNTVQCRLAFVSRAFDDAPACASAIGGGECR